MCVAMVHAHRERCRKRPVGRHSFQTNAMHKHYGRESEFLCAEPEGSRPAESGGATSEPGVWLFVLGDMILFALLFLSYAWDYKDNYEMFRSGQAQLDQNIGLINTLLLLTGSMSVVIGVGHARKSRLRIVTYCLIGAICTGVLFYANKIHEYYHEISVGNTMTKNMFFMYYYTLTLIHLLHVSVGIGVLTFLACRLNKLPRDGRLVNYIESGGAIWHMVDLLWIALFPLLYLIPVSPF